MVSGLKMCNLKDDVTIAVNLSVVETNLSEFRIGDCKFEKNITSLFQRFARNIKSGPLFV